MSTRITVVGAGGFARELIGIVGAIERAAPGTLEIVGAVDDAPLDTDLELLQRLGVAYLGGFRTWASGSVPGERFVIAIGSPAVRASVDETASAVGLIPATVVHPTATIGPLATLGPGTVLSAGAHLSTNVRTGRQTHVGAAALVGHDTTTGDHVSINPGAVVSGAVEIGPRALIGAGATVLQSRRIGPDSTVGAAACVTRDVPAGRVVTGIPAR